MEPKEYVLVVRQFNWDKSVSDKRVRCLAYSTDDVISRFQLTRQGGPLGLGVPRQQLLDVMPYIKSQHEKIVRFLGDDEFLAHHEQELQEKP